MKIKCGNCGHIEETTLDFFVKIIGGAMPIGGFFAWTTFLFAGTGFAMPIVVAIIAGGPALIIYKDKIVQWIINRGYKCQNCDNIEWKCYNVDETSLIDMLELHDMLTEKYKKLVNSTKNKNSDIKYKFIESSKDINETIIKLINNAKRCIYMAVYSLSEFTILDSIANKSHCGIEVKILTDFSTVKKQSKKDKIFYCFEQQNTEVKLWGRNFVDSHYSAPLMHRKELIIDEEIFLLGSANFTRQARDYNIESAFLIEGTDIMQEILRSFNDVYNSPQSEYYKQIKKYL